MPKIIQTTGTYTPRILGEVSYEAFLKRVQMVDDSYFIMNAEVSTPSRWGRWWRKEVSKSVLLLDCDSTDRMLAASHTLATRNIKYVPIQSSPGRYWIVADRVDKMSILLFEMQTIPGVDTSYVEVACRTNFLALRVVPTEGKMALFQDGGADHFTNPLARGWYNDFKSLWDRPEIKEKAKAWRVQNALAEGTLTDLIGDPDFIL